MPKVGTAVRPSIGSITSLVSLDAKTRSIAAMSAPLATVPLFDENSGSRHGQVTPPFSDFGKYRTF